LSPKNYRMSAEDDRGVKSALHAGGKDENTNVENGRMRKTRGSKGAR